MPLSAAGAGRAQAGAGAAHSRGEKRRQEEEQENMSSKGFWAPECPDAQTGPQRSKVKKYTSITFLLSIGTSWAKCSKEELGLMQFFGTCRVNLL